MYRACGFGSSSVGPAARVCPGIAAADPEERKFRAVRPGADSWRFVPYLVKWMGNICVMSSWWDGPMRGDCGGSGGAQSGLLQTEKFAANLIEVSLSTITKLLTEKNDEPTTMHNMGHCSSAGWSEPHSQCRTCQHHQFSQRLPLRLLQRARQHQRGYRRGCREPQCRSAELVCHGKPHFFMDGLTSGKCRQGVSASAINARGGKS